MIMAGRGKHLADIKEETKKVGASYKSTGDSSVDLSFLIKKINEINKGNINQSLLANIQNIIKELITSQKVMKDILSSLHSKALDDAEFGVKLVLALEQMLYLEIEGVSLRNELLPFIQNDFEVRETMFESDTKTFLNSVVLLGNAYNVFKVGGKPFKIFGAALLDYFDLLIKGREEELKTLTQQIFLNGINLKRENKFELLMQNLRNTLINKNLNSSSKCWILLALDFISNDLKPLEGVIKDFYLKILKEEYTKLENLIPPQNDQVSLPLSPDSTKSQDSISPRSKNINSNEIRTGGFKKDLPKKLLDMSIKCDGENKDKIQLSYGKNNKKDFWKSSGSNKIYSDHDDRFEREESYYGIQKSRKLKPENQKKKFNDIKSIKKTVEDFKTDIDKSIESA